MRAGRSIALAVALAVILVAGAAAAQASVAEEADDARREEAVRAKGDDLVPDALRHEIALDTRFWSADAAGSTFSFALRGQIVPVEHFGVAVTLPWAFNNGSVIYYESIAALGNLTVDPFVASRSGIATWRGGLGLSLPTASADDAAWYFATLFANAAAAQYDAHLFQWGYFPVRPFGDVELHPGRVVTVKLGLALSIFLPVERDSARVSPGLSLSTDSVEVSAQQYADLQLLSDIGLGGGIRLQAVEFPTAGDDEVDVDGGGPDDDVDAAQLALEPYLAFDNRKGLFARLGLLVALDERLGFGFDVNRVATLHLAVGGYWDGSAGL